MTSHIFINYRRQDSEGYVGRLYDHLAQHFPPDTIFMDVSSIEPGADFVQALEDAVAACDVFLAVIGPGWLDAADAEGVRRLDRWNDFVRIEIASALKQGKHVIPVLVGRAVMPAPDALPDDLVPLARRNALELSHRRFAYDVGQLIASIKTVVNVQPAVKTTQDPAVLDEKTQALRQIRLDLIDAADSPLYEYRTANGLLPVLGAGSPDANIVFIGESPGKHEAQGGEPFAGPSGDVLDELLAGVGLRRADIFLTNVLLDKPEKKRAPHPAEIAYYTPFVDRILDVIQPGVIVPLGRFATTYILRKFELPEARSKISDLHGKLLRAQADYGPIHILPLYHPAVVLYSASKRGILAQDFDKLKLFI